jgi:hypothetical protein
MLEVADIFRAAGSELCARLAALPSQRQALQAIQQCRTAALGGQVYGCAQCGALHYSYHSCGNRHCPKCHGQQTQRWLEQQRARLLPCPYYLLTFTLPAELRALARSQQKLLYGLLLSAAAASTLKLCADPRWLGAQPSLMGLVHTWTRALLYHPHVHFLVSAGGLSADGQRWLPAKNPNFLLPVRALSVLFRAKVKAGLKAAGHLPALPAKVWQQPWVVHAQSAGSGQKVLDYLGRYVFRIAITQSRLERLEANHVTFRYRDNRTQQIQHLRLTLQEFVQRFLQHVLPKGLAKVRHYGLDSSACRPRHAKALALLQPTALPPPAGAAQWPLPTPTAPRTPVPVRLRCPHCDTGQLVWLGQLWPSKKIPP